MSKLVIEFPNEESREAFLHWFCDGIGEQEFMQWSKEYAANNAQKPIVQFTYEQAFPAWGYDPAKHGPDKTVLASDEWKPFRKSSGGRNDA